MIAVIFEGFVQPNGKEQYLELSDGLKPMMDDLEGFISVERFQSVADPGKILSLSFWKDEEAIRRFRQIELHQVAELQGRQEIFSDYRIRVAHVTRDYGISDRKEAPGDPS